MSIFLNTYRKAQSPEQTHFCPGCGHGNILKFVDNAISKLDIANQTIWVSPVGCGGLTDSYLSISHILAPHGRASAVATAVKRTHPDAVVIVSQGDGDLASIGFLEAIHAANRGENFTVFFINNANFAMTGGQMAPTTLLGQKTPTSPLGRLLPEHGAPLKVCEIINQLEAPAFIARVAIGSDSQLIEAEKIIHKAIDNQIHHVGYSFVEILSPCPSNWHCSPLEARERVVSEMTKTFPLGIFRDISQQPLIEQRLPITAYTPEGVIAPYEALAKPTDVATMPPIQIQNLTSICFAGFGGQGVLTLGKWLAKLALTSGLQATWIPSYGPEMRGGSANCFVRIDHNSISSPIVDNPDILFAMNQPAIDAFLPKLRPTGTLVYDVDSATLPDECSVQNIIPVHAVQTANALNSSKSANLVMLSAWLKHIGANMSAVQTSLFDDIKDKTAAQILLA